MELLPNQQWGIDEECYGRGNDGRLYYSTNNNNDYKITILYYFLFNIHLPNDIVTKTIDLHLPDGRTASPFYPPLQPTVSGWLLCESLSNGGCLMQYHHICSVILCFILFPYQNDRSSPPRWPHRLSLLSFITADCFWLVVV